MSRSALLGFAGVFMAVSTAHATIVVTPTDDPNALASTILGGGITINSATIVTGTSSSTGVSQFGTFTGGSTVGGGFFDQGIILSSGDVADAIGPNTSDGTTTGFSGAGDADLTAISGFNTLDAAVFTINFTSDGGDIFFNYIFASEEYNEFTNSSFNDPFAFFLDGTNIALIPGTSTPVTINTVNGGNPLGTNATHPEFYNNNDLNDGGPFFDIEYDGFTDVFTASFLGLSAGTHTLKIAIADASDTILDSAVFIQAGTFSDTLPPAAIPEPTSFALFIVGLLGLGFMRRRRAAA